ncbi:hypothetical protein Pcinc_032200 [Petrolisthes cinctipes]|uniref:Uncharacterized protein n=1 Tax=Petrolisthes cinctipes TaxID=88211 RepID=A0AAE1EV98_PETCI|nr:hypothetical protein Pcinc_032200 [Petrolisthes cinctipes]
MESVVDVPKEEYEFNVESTASLSNSDVLSNLYSKLQLLSPKQTEDIHQLLIDFPDLCRDVPRPYNKIEHDVVLCESVVPIKQAQYRVSPSPVKQKKMQEEASLTRLEELAPPGPSSPALSIAAYSSLWDDFTTELNLSLEHEGKEISHPHDHSRSKSHSCSSGEVVPSHHRESVSLPSSSLKCPSSRSLSGKARDEAGQDILGYSGWPISYF